MIGLIFSVLLVFSVILIIFGITGLAGLVIGMVIPLTFTTAMKLIGLGLCLFAVAILITVGSEIRFKQRYNERKTI